MTRYVVQCVFGGTKTSIPASGHNPHVAVDKAKKSKIGRRASAFVVFERKTGNVVHAAVNR